VRNASKTARVENDLAFLSADENRENVRLWYLRLHERWPFVCATLSHRKAFGDSPIVCPMYASLSALFASAPDRMTAGNAS